MESTGQNDIGVILLQNPLDFNSGLNLGPVCLPAPGAMHDIGTVVQVSGWGLTSGTGPVANDLLAVNVTIAENAECGGQSTRPVTEENQICTNTPGMSSCRGDSGGPLTTVNPDTGRMELVGLVSFGPVECDGMAVFARVSYFLDFIHAATSDATCY